MKNINIKKLAYQHVKRVLDKVIHFITEDEHVRKRNETREVQREC